MEHRTLEINVMSATDLNKVNLITKMDVFVIVEISGDGKQKQKAKTPVDKDGDSNPTWNYQMKFTIDEASAQQNRLSLVFKLKCERALGDKDIGEVHVPIIELLQSGHGDGFGGKQQFVSYQVRKPSGKPKGQLTFGYKFDKKLTMEKADSHHEPMMAYPATGNHAVGPSSVYPPAHVAGQSGSYPPPAKDGYHYPQLTPTGESGSYPPPAKDEYHYPPPAPAGESGSYPPPAKDGYHYPPPAPVVHHAAPPTGYPYPPPPPPAPPAGYGHPPPPPYGGYPPPPAPGYGYPPQPGYGYPPVTQQQPPKKSNSKFGLGLGLLGGALGGMLIGDMISDDGGFGDGGFDF